MKKETLGTLSLILCALIWGISFSAVDTALDCEFQTFTILSIRGILAGLLLLPFALKKKFWKNKKLLIHSTIAGVLFFGGYAAQTIGQSMTDTVHSAFYTALYVVLTPFIAIFFGKKDVKLQVFLAAISALVGLFFLNFLANGQKFTLGLGDFILFLCALFFALQIIWVGKYFDETCDPISSSCVMLFAMGICSLVVLPFTKETLPTDSNHLWLGLGCIVYASIMSSGICSLLQLYGQKYVKPAKASILLSLETTFACLTVAILELFNHNSTMNLYSWIGLLFMVLSVLLVEVKFVKKYDFSKYEYLLIDVDDTLLDFKGAEKLAFKELCEKHQITYSEELLAWYSAENDSWWKKFEKKECTYEDIFNYRYIPFKERFKIDMTPREISDEYLGYLGGYAIILNNSKEELIRLKKKYHLYVITNGDKNVQMSRLNKVGLTELFDGLFISQEIGYQKPSKEFFDYVASHIEGFDITKAIVIGDSLTSDIKGAKMYHIDTCLYTANIRTDVEVDYQISTLEQIK